MASNAQVDANALLRSLGGLGGLGGVLGLVQPPTAQPIIRLLPAPQPEEEPGAEALQGGAAMSGGAAAGLAQALQSMIGNNFGAGLWHRSDSTLRAGLIVAFVYCGLAELVLTLFSHQVGFAFVDDPGVAAEVGRILPVIMALYFVAGPLFMVATYFQALGDAARAALLSLAKPYAFFLPLVFLMPVYFGVGGIWLSSPLAELMLLVVTLVLLGITARTGTARWGLFRAVPAN